MSLNEKVRVTWGDLEVGRKLIWDIYSESGKLLLKAGQTIPSSQVLEGMCKYVLYRYVSDGETAHSKKHKRINVFVELPNFIHRLKNIFIHIENGDVDCLDKIERLAKEIQAICMLEPDATIAVFHLPNEHPHSQFHALQCAILCAFLIQEEDFSEHEQQMIVAAALTANCSMHALQDKIAKQDGMLTPDQDDRVRSHPEKSVRLLQAIGVNDKTWLMTVLNHHERGDASGYPSGLMFDDIGKGSFILAMADCYSSMISERDYHHPIFIKDALNVFLLNDGKAYDSQYALRLIKQLSIFPPGSFVTLNNGEIAVVVKRGLKDPMKPIVKSFLGPDKKRYINPLYRECGTNGYEVEAMSGYDPNIPLNYSHIWEYS